MKTLLTILMGFMLTITAFAADRRPTVTVNGSNNYEIVIDGRRYVNNNNNYINITNLRNGRHSIEVYEIRRGLFRKTSKLVSSSQFILRGNDVSILIDRYGDLRINESYAGNNGFGNKGYGNNGYGNNGYGNNGNNGNNGYGNNGYGNRNNRDNDHDADDNYNNGRNKRNKDWDNKNSTGQNRKY